MAIGIVASLVKYNNYIYTQIEKEKYTLKAQKQKELAVASTALRQRN